MDIEFILTEYNGLSAEQKKQAAHDLLADGPEKLLPYCSGMHARAALRVLADMGRGAADFSRANAAFFLAQLKSEDPKVRMLAAEILGSAAGIAGIGEDGKPQKIDFTKELVAACHAEQTMFALPSFLLAIGAQKTEAAKRYLEHYTVRSDADKHIREEKLALQKAMANFYRAQADPDTHPARRRARAFLPQYVRHAGRSQTKRVQDP